MYVHVCFTCGHIYACMMNLKMMQPLIHKCYKCGILNVTFAVCEGKSACALMPVRVQLKKQTNQRTRDVA